MTHKHGRVDENQPTIVKQLRDVPGVSVAITSDLGDGFPDIIVGFRGRNWLFELKMPGKKLTTDEIGWHQTWTGQVNVAYSVEDVLLVIGAVSMSEFSDARLAQEMYGKA